jgi:hypothetical protein
MLPSQLPSLGCGQYQICLMRAICQSARRDLWTHKTWHAKHTPSVPSILQPCRAGDIGMPGPDRLGELREVLYVLSTKLWLRSHGGARGKTAVRHNGVHIGVAGQAPELLSQPDDEETRWTNTTLFA